jgi:hypothetical protein
MKPHRFPFVFQMAAAFSFIVLSAAGTFAASTIAGYVYDKQRNAVIDVDVELVDDLYRMVPGGRKKTDGTGHYEFTGLSDGRYTVRVFPFRYDLQDAEFMVEINTQSIRGGPGVGYYTQDFYLTPKKGGLKDAELSVVFAQEVPKAAQDAYEKAQKDFSDKKKSEGFAGLQKALSIFPTYYNALHRFGLELFLARQYMDSAGVFMRAVQVNPKSATSFYYLGYSLHNAGDQYNKSALTATSEALTLAPASIQVLFLMAKIERDLGKFTDAEKHLLLAKKNATAKTPEIHLELSQLYSDDLKRYKEAADELENYIKAARLNGPESEKVKKIVAGLREKAKGQAVN